MNQVEIYSKNWCSFCKKAKALLQENGIGYDEIDVTNDLDREWEMVERAKAGSVPQIFVNGEHIGGYDSLKELLESGELKRMLKQSPKRRNPRQKPPAWALKI